MRVISQQSFQILTPFLRTIYEYRNGKYCCRFVFYNNMHSFWRPFPMKFLGKSRTRGREKNYVIFTSFPWSILSRTIALDQLERERSLCCCKTFISILLQKVTLLILCFPDPNYAVVDAASTTAWWGICTVWLVTGIQCIGTATERLETTWQKSQEWRLPLVATQ